MLQYACRYKGFRVARLDNMVRTKQLGEHRFISVRMPQSLIARLESEARKTHKNRSTVIRELLVQALEDGGK